MSSLFRGPRMPDPQPMQMPKVEDVPEVDDEETLAAEAEAQRERDRKRKGRSMITEETKQIIVLGKTFSSEEERRLTSSYSYPKKNYRYRPTRKRNGYRRKSNNQRPIFNTFASAEAK